MNPRPLARHVCSWMAAVSAAAPAFSQGLVPNPSFEQYSALPSGYSQLARAVGWTTPTTDGTSDYFHMFATSTLVTVPTNALGTQAPKYGRAYGGFIAYDDGNEYREYLQVQLTSPLLAGEEYKVSVWVSLADLSAYAIDSIGIHFRDSAVAESGYAPLPLTPQVVTAPGVPLTNTTGWTLVSGRFTADGGEEYMIIGNFLSDRDVHLTDMSDASPFAYYYVDGVQVTRMYRMSKFTRRPSV